MKKKIIINADDLGFSLGVNEAIKNAHLDGYLSHASLMCNTDFFNHALKEIIPVCPDLKIGLHVNLTCGKALYEGNVLAKDGKLNSSFVKLLLMPKKKKVLDALEHEIESQLLEAKKNNIFLNHIDGHEHIHIIPSINKIVKKLAKKHSIKRIREINENIITSSKFNLRTASLANIIKLMLLRFLSLFNDNKNEIKFYSILNTCEINEENLFNYLEKGNDDHIEIMLHPGTIEMDKNYNGLDKRFIDFLRSDFRTQEYNVCFNNKFEDYEAMV
ncbi:carbohydrate deacetylase [Chryseobacterium gambrini]|uniref:carbohydrate deacetylase n=1 Tax=Chryseobacterium TaxID=59732 RepID=UPI0025B2F40D|nr:ChbG/HpnK family deacetylase [Chryseobacterium gambrini]MDN4029927.1 ChbG/HpnK family deacetylase [Chryseobacterium gambrini]